MATAAAIDRLVHHSVLLEFDVPSFRTEQAKRRGKPPPPRGGRIVTTRPHRMPRSDDRLGGRPQQVDRFVTAARDRADERPWTLPAPWTRGRAHRALENGGPFPTAPTAIVVL